MRVRLDARIAMLSRLELFAGCTRRELARVASLSTEVALPAGDVLLREGEIGREAFVLLEGSAAVSAGDRPVSVLAPGALFGDMGLVEHQPFAATVVATSPVTVLVLTPRELDAVLDGLPAVEERVRKIRAERKRELARAAV